MCEGIEMRPERYRRSGFPTREAIDAAGETLTALEDIALGHKIALRDIAAGELVYKYGVPIGRASQAIAKGAWVHTHNLQDITEELCNRYAEEFRKKARAGV